MHKPFLFDFFSEIMQDQQWINPGMEEYFLLDTLMKSEHFKPTSFKDLAFALETMWFKSHNSPNSKERFRQMLEDRRKAITEALEEWVKDLKRMETAETVAATIAHQPLEEQEKDKDQERTEGASPAVVQNNKPTEDAIKTATAPAEEVTNGDGALQPVFSLTMPLKVNKESEESLINRPYVFTNDYFPVKNRHMQQAWRTLKNKQDAGTDTAINFPHTITRMARQGYFSGFVYNKKTVNQLQLFVFIDQSETMVAEEEFGREICAAAISSNMYPGLEPLYFNKVPAKDKQRNDYLLFNEDVTAFKTLGKLFAPYFKKDIVVLLYSDAGAFKKETDEDRLKDTKAFINHLYRKSGYLAWLNPAPKERWSGTNAGKLNKEVPMFETGNSKTGRSEFERAMAALKGKLMC
ncbi:hypothetical protein [Niastella sp. OAS944]|uniref:hypothetical protein n=1 Tax=Niastella sp. OAS944 TaxID=2664089 RepID=UPI00348ACA13|nr:uncharacterized protein with von Willebrand factor type A (vWA) domain [Chitinophagaceae bacterium OAS944]